MFYEFVYEIEALCTRMPLPLCVVWALFFRVPPQDLALFPDLRDGPSFPSNQTESNLALERKLGRRPTNFPAGFDDIPEDLRVVSP